MVTPLESSVSILSADHYSNQVKDPNATHAMGAQLIDVKKEAEQRSATVQGLEETDTYIKVGEKDREKEERGGKKKKRDGQASEDEEVAETERRPETSRGFSFIA